MKNNNNNNKLLLQGDSLFSRLVATT